MEHRTTFAAAAMLVFACAMHAATYPPSYRWRTITTEHFHIHFHQGEEQAAERLAAIAERVHATITPLADYAPKARTHVVLTDNVDVPNGSATPFPFNRVEIYLTAPGADPSSPIVDYDDWLNLVFTHEYAHILHLDQAGGSSRILQKIFGRNLAFFPNELSPLWLIEGYATYIESTATDAGRLNGTYLDMVLRTAAVEDRWLDEATASGLTPAWPGGNARYYYGAKFLSWLARREGNDKLAEYLHRYAADFWPYNVNGPARGVYAQKMSTLWRTWSDEQKTAYRSEAETLRAAGLTPRRRITSLGFGTKYPAVSPDGRRVAFGIEDPFDWPSIRVVDVASGGEVARLKVNSLSPLSWSADGKSIAFSQLEFVGSFSLLSDVYVWQIDGGVRRLTHGARLKDPAFTTRGEIIAVENRDGRNRLVEVSGPKGTIRAVVIPKDNSQFSEPSVSHDGTRIAVAEWKNGRIDVVLYGRDGRRIANLTESLQRSTNASPRFSPDDRTVFFSSDVTGVSNIYSVAAGGGGAPQRLTNVYGGAFFPSTADGKNVVFSDYLATGYDVSAFEVSSPLPVRPRPLTRPSPNLPALAEVRGWNEPYSPWSSLRPRWWFPQIGDSGIGVISSGADALGRHSFFLSTAGSDYSAFYAYNGFYPTITIAADRDRQHRPMLVADATFPLIHNRWQTFGSVGIVRDRLAQNITLQGVRAWVMFNNSYERGYAVSPENGVRLSAAMENFGGDRSLRTTLLDARAYRGIPVARSPLGRHALALRVVAGRNTGDLVPQRDFRLGGAGSGDLAVFDTTELPVRGFEPGTLRGRKATTGSLEYRFPLYQIDRGPSTWPLFFNRIVGDVFTDAGRTNETIASAGAEVGVDVVLGFFFPLRYRIGGAYRLKPRGGTQFYAAFSTSF